MNVKDNIEKFEEPKTDSEKKIYNLSEKIQECIKNFLEEEYSDRYMSNEKCSVLISALMNHHVNVLFNIGAYIIDEKEMKEFIKEIKELVLKVHEDTERLIINDRKNKKEEI